MSARATPKTSRASRLANSFGLTEAIAGLLAGFVLSVIAVSIFDQASGHSHHPSSYGEDIASLIGLWIGLLGAILFALGRRLGFSERLAAMKERYGLSLSLWPDVPVGIAVGVGSQFVLVPLLDLILQPFVHNLSYRLGQPARTLTAHVSGAGLLVLGLLVCLGSPMVEELFFRGLFFRGLLGRLAPLGRATAPVSMLITGILFGLVHFEALQLLALIGFGVVLSGLAYRFGRLGPGIIAHIAFNTTTFIALARTH